MTRSYIVLASVCLAVLGGSPARAAELEEVADWGASGVPDYVDMFIYVPDALADAPPIVVISHFCGGNANLFFSIFQGSVVAAADEHGFIVIFPQATGQNCWDVGSTAALTRDGGGDTEAIVQMVSYALDTYDGDPTRVYAMGISSGAMMTQALLGLYPDVFKAGAALSGVPCGCWAEGYDANARWSSSCAEGNVDKTAEQWGDTVRAMYPSYTGHRPRVQLWHGASDPDISYTNFGEAIEEWTNVLSLDTAPDATDAQPNDFTRQRWQNDCGYDVLETWSQANGTHDVPIMGEAIISFLGLDVVGPDPEDARCEVDAGTGGTGSEDAGMEPEPDAGSTGGGGGLSGSGGAGGAGGDAMVPPSGGTGGSAGTSATMDAQIDDDADAGTEPPNGSSKDSGGCTATPHNTPPRTTATLLACTACAALWLRRRHR